MTARRPYPAYKDSGIAWLEKIPAHWDVALLKRAFSVQLGKMLRNEPATSKDTKEPYLRAANITWQGVDISTIKKMWFSPGEKATYALKEGDLLVSEGGDVGRSALWKRELDKCYIQNAVNRVRSHGYHSTHFLYYWMYVIKHSGYIDILCNKATIAHFTAEKVAAVEILLPPLSEQRAIAAFLDRETGRIDALIAKKQRLIELLQEKRTALISHAVTKGLDSGVAMKDSGVTYLQAIPKEWDMLKIRNISRVVRGQTPRPAGDPRFFHGASIPWITVGEVTKDTSMYLTDTRTMLTEAGKNRSIVFKAGTLVLTNSGATLGVPKRLSITGCMNDGIAAFRDISADMIVEYIYFYFLSLTRYLRELSQGMGQPNLNTTIISNLRIPKPPKEEQQQIVVFLNNELSKLDFLIARIKIAVEKLQEYRTALISAAVTGKIDVREKVAVRHI